MLTTTFSRTSATANAHDDQSHDHETHNDNNSNGPARKPVSHALRSDSGAPAVVPGVMAAISCTLTVAGAVLVLVSGAVSRVAISGNISAGPIV